MAVPRGHAGWTPKKRNFGYGRRLPYAALSALHDYFGHSSQYQTQHTHHARFKTFANWLFEQHGIRDARLITQRHIQGYGDYLLSMVTNGFYTVSYAQNLLSTLNVVMRCMRHDRRLYTPPSKIVGRRSYIRKTVPECEWVTVLSAVQQLEKVNNNSRAGAVLLLGRAFGMRVREAALANLIRLEEEATKFGTVTILDGTKGGRKCLDREIPVGDFQLLALRYALEVSPEGSRNLLQTGETYKNFLDRVIDPGRKALKNNRLIDYREMRAGFALDIYEVSSEQPAPIKQKPIDQEAHKRAEALVSRLLGHGRPHISRSYIG